MARQGVCFYRFLPDDFLFGSSSGKKCIKRGKKKEKEFPKTLQA